MLIMYITYSMFVAVLVTDLVRYDNIFYGLARNVYDGDFDTTITTNNRQSTFTAYHYASVSTSKVSIRSKFKMTTN